MVYSKDIKDELLLYVKDNPDKSLRRISEEFNIPYSTVYRWCVCAHIQTSPYTDHDKEYCLAYLADNKTKSLLQISEELAVPYMTLKTWRDKYVVDYL